VPEGLTADRVVPRLRGRFGRPYTHVAECPSTQRLLEPDAAEGAVAVAEHQTEGRGRLGRSWVDEPGRSLLFSLCLRPAVPTERWAELTPIAGRATADAIEAAAGIRAEIKPPNDLLINGRKVAGILAEAAEGRIVLGIGVNVGSAPYGGAGALGQEVDRAELLVELLARLERAYDGWVAGAVTAT
jgi:BirA family transcriptional regulator, biotin operon repressor / biotin---[acetyl-CoA-carboxylase] ligase